ELHQLAADAAAGHLDQLADAGRAGGRRRNDLGAAPLDLVRRLLDEARERLGLGPPPQLLEDRPPLGAQRAQEVARLVEVLRPAPTLARPQVGGQRLGLGAGGGEPGALRVRLRTGRVEAGPALLEPSDGTREVAALAREDGLGGGERPLGEAKPPGDRQRKALPDGVVGEPVVGSTAKAATSSAGSASANAFTWPKCVVSTSRAPRARRSPSTPTASAAPSTGSVPTPGSSSSTRTPGPAAAAIAARLAACALNVERSRSIDCSSPTSASTAANTGSRAPSAAGTKRPACAMSAQRPSVLSATVLPPALGPVSASPARSAGTWRSTGTTGRPAASSSGCRAAGSAISAPPRLGRVQPCSA